MEIHKIEECIAYFNSGIGFSDSVSSLDVESRVIDYAGPTTRHFLKRLDGLVRMLFFKVAK